MESILNLSYRFKKFYFDIDSKYVVPFILLTYNILGLTILGFNRSWSQILLTVLVGVFLHLFFDYLFKKKCEFNVSAVTTSLGLCILINYGHSLIYPIIPIFLAISSKYIFNFKGRHTYNPAMFGVAASLLLAPEFISSSPAYQWNGAGSMAIVIVMSALIFFMPKINRGWLVGSFLFVFTLQILLRSILIKHYLPFNTLFFGTITSPSFFLFTFFMITDPMTSPNDKKQQIIVGVSLALLDLIFHLISSYHTFFYAAFTLGTIRLTWFHFKEAKSVGFLKYFSTRFYQSGYYRKLATILFIMFGSYYSYNAFAIDKLNRPDIGFTFEEISSSQTGFHFQRGDVLDQVDERVQHMGKWILAITDGVAVGDYDQDGLVDVFFTNGHKSTSERNSLFKNLGNFKFEKVESPVLSLYGSDVKKFGIPANAMFVDYDNDTDLDLFITYAFGREGTSRMFKNLFIETGKTEFKNVTDELNLNKFTNAATANFFDMNNDGFLDLIVGNTIATHLPDYQTPVTLDLFQLPKEEYQGDKRPYNFMHASWHRAENGSMNDLYLQKADKTFELTDSKKMGMPETKWTMAIGTSDFNQDGFIDLYMANDFGADDLYYNKHGEKFESFRGTFFGEVGKDTYKGMNATVADFDNNGMSDIHISNVHHQLQAEGNLLYYFFPQNGSKFPKIEDRATHSGALNENRFGWGAAAADFNNDGWIDLAQANGMVDDLIDKKYDSCPDFWYINEKIARSSPDVHRYISNWGDIRGTCIHGFEHNRLYLNRGLNKRPQFLDVAQYVGMNHKANFRGMASADFDNDGRIDLIVSSLYRDPIVLKNKAINQDLEHPQNWIGLNLQSKNPLCNQMALGSKIWVTLEDNKNDSRTLYLETNLINGFSAQHDQRIHVGIADSKIIKEVKIAWCGQENFMKSYTNINMNQYNSLIYAD
jgi:Na+-translocating ferredoxin:NAD+ oxidoreductase RnfD subunit